MKTTLRILSATIAMTLAGCPGDDSGAADTTGADSGTTTTGADGGPTSGSPTTLTTTPDTDATTNAGDTTTNAGDTTTNAGDTTDGGSTAADSGTDGGAVCGDDVIGGTEACDGADLGGATCESEGFAGGVLACDAACAFDTSGCVQAVVMCVDVAADMNCVDADPATCTCQACDPGNGCEASEDCVCPDCAADAFCADPANCDGDGLCDPYLEGCGCADCAGHIECGPPAVCGDMVIAPSEDCEGIDLGGADCASLGFLGGGALACDAGCQFDTTGCMGLQCADVTGCGDADPATCTCEACDPGNGCEDTEDCVCPDCAADTFCSDPVNCVNDGICNPYNEGCVCADCVGHPLCP